MTAFEANDHCMSVDFSGSFQFNSHNSPTNRFLSVIHWTVWRENHTAKLGPISAITVSQLNTCQTASLAE